MKNPLIFALIMMTLLATPVLAQGLGGHVALTLSLINQDPDPAVVGDIVEIRVGLENKGSNSLLQTVVELVDEYPFEKLPGEDLVQNIGTIGNYQGGDDVKVVKFKLRIDRDATAGQYSLKVLQYSQGDTQKAKVEHHLNIDVKSRENAEVIYIDQVEILPGKVTPMTFTINNVGSAPLRELTFSWENEDGVILPVGSDNTKYIKYLGIGEKVDLIYDVLASGNAEPDLYKLNLKLTYNDPLTSLEKEISTTAGVYIGGETDFDVTFSGVSKGEASFSISNIGSVPANSVTIKIEDQMGWRVSGSDSVIIGNLNKGDYTIAGFKLQARGGGTSGERPNGQEWQKRMQEGLQEGERRQRQETVDITIDYTDTRGQRHTTTNTVKVDPNAFMQASGEGAANGQWAGQQGGRHQQQSSNTIYLIIAGSAVVLLFWLYRRSKKGKKSIVQMLKSKVRKK